MNEFIYYKTLTIHFDKIVIVGNESQRLTKQAGNIMPDSGRST